MPRLFLMLGLVCAVGAAPATDDQGATILNFENESDGRGNYRFSFETSNGISREEKGTVVNEGQSDQYIYVEGIVSYIDADGKKQEFRYTADENGYEVLTDQKVTFQGSLSPNVVATLLG